MAGMKRFTTECPFCHSWPQPSLVARQERDISYWFCRRCGRYFDTAGNELMDDEVVGRMQVDSLTEGFRRLSPGKR